MAKPEHEYFPAARPATRMRRFEPGTGTTPAASPSLEGTLHNLCAIPIFARLVLTWPCSTVVHMAKAARVLAALNGTGGSRAGGRVRTG
jgi:hypothetical protein